ncbi:MAG: HD domain-containing protein [Candidatus Hodarchaeota archaeon]
MFIKDAIHSYIAIPEFYQPLIDSIPVQRLRRIRQLAGTEYVYPGATHTRFEHSLGVMYLAGKLCDILNQNGDKATDTGIINDLEKKSIISGALLHDIGHGPFSHVYEKLYEDEKKNHEDITDWLIKTELKETLENMGLDPGTIAKLATGKGISKEKLFMSQIIAGTIDCDSLDYLERDSYYTGARIGNLDVQRILLMTRVHGGNIVFDLKISLPVLENYFLVRLNSFKQVYYHKTSRAAQIMIYNALKNNKSEYDLGIFKEPKDFLKWDDYTIWTAIKDDPFIIKLSKRDLLKLAYEKGSMSNEINGKKLSHDEIIELEGEIANKAGIPEEEVFIDVPYLKTVPYAHATTFDPEDIPVFVSGQETIKKFSDLSVVFSLLKGHYNFLRVYCAKEHRKEVEKASQEVLNPST